MVPSGIGTVKLLMWLNDLIKNCSLFIFITHVSAVPPGIGTVTPNDPDVELLMRELSLVRIHLTDGAGTPSATQRKFT